MIPTSAANPTDAANPANAIVEASIQHAREVGLRYVVPTEPGIHRYRHGRGFVYRKESGKAVTDAKTLERIRSLVIPPAWENVWICPSGRGHLQATGRDAKGRRQYLYHPSYRQARDLNKFNRMVTFGAVLPRIRRIVARDLAREGLPKRKVMAVVVRLLDRTCIRIGNAEYARQNESYGLTTFRDKHVRIEGACARFRFRGKSGVQQEVEVADARLAQLLQQLRDVPGPDLFQYIAEDGKRHAILSADINEYLRQISGAEVTAKDFRTWHGTIQMLWELFQCGPATSATEAKRRLSTAVKTTAERLGNRPATCRGYYVHPEVIESYMSRRLFRSMCDPRSAADCESALLKLVKHVRRSEARRKTE